MADNEHGPDGFSEESIVRALELARARIASAERERNNLDRIITTAREEERLLQQLLNVRRGVSPNSEPKFQDGSARQANINPSRWGKHPSVQAVIDELATAGRPLHISELMRLLHDRNVAIPGAGTQANLIAHLRRDSRLVRTSRGMYGLAIWGIESMRPARPVLKRRKRFRATAKE